MEGGGGRAGQGAVWRACMGEEGVQGEKVGARGGAREEGGCMGWRECSGRGWLRGCALRRVWGHGGEGSAVAAAGILRCSKGCPQAPFYKGSGRGGGSRVLLLLLLLLRVLLLCVLQLKRVLHTPRKPSAAGCAGHKAIPQPVHHISVLAEDASGRRGCSTEMGSTGRCSVHWRCPEGRRGAP